MNYVVYNPSTRKWLSDDEKSWTADFYAAAQFRDGTLADDIAKREYAKHEDGFKYLVFGFDDRD